MRVREALERCRDAGWLSAPPIFDHPILPPAWWQEHTGDADGLACWERMVTATSDLTRSEPVVTPATWTEIQQAEIRRRAHYVASLWMAEDRARALAADRLVCQRSVVHWMDHHGWIEDTHQENPARRDAPLVMYPAQRVLIWWYVERQRLARKGVVVKSRSIGASWIACLYAVWRWLFEPYSASRFGSRTGSEVDRGEGDTESLFGKLRWAIDHQPAHLMPDPDERSTSAWEQREPDGEDVKRIRWQLVNRRAQSRIMGGTATGTFSRGGRGQGTVYDEFAFLDPRIQDSIRAASATVSRADVMISTPNGPGDRFHREYQDSPSEDIVELPWTVDPRRDIAWYDGLLIEHGGVLTRSERAQEADCSFAGIESHQIWIISETALYDDDDPDWLVEHRRRLPHVGGLDIGHGASLKAYAHLLLDWTAGMSTDLGRLPRVWVDWSRTWERTEEGEVAAEILGTWAEDYGGPWSIWADPSVDTTGPGQLTSRRLFARAGLTNIQPLDHELLDPVVAKLWLDRIQSMWASGLIRVHRGRAVELWQAATSWRWAVRQGVHLDQVARSSVKWGKDRPSHLAEALWYGIACAIIHHQPLAASTAGPSQLLRRRSRSGLAALR